MEALSYVLILIISFTVTEIHATAKDDNFDKIMDRMKSVNAENCASKSTWDLTLPREYVTHVPYFNNIRDGIPFANRSVLRQMHSMALNRGFYYSFIYKMLDQSKDFKFQPGAMYLYMSSAADVSANPGWAEASSLLFNKNCMYPNWFGNVDFNKTLLYFGPRAVRVSGKSNQQEAEEAEVEDYAVTPGIGDHDPYKYCPFAQNDGSFWWPDEESRTVKHSYTTYIRRSTQVGQFEKDDQLIFSGPPSGTPDETSRVTHPMTPPYFDCGRTNRWIVSMTAPVTEFMARYNMWTHMRRNRYTAVAGVDVDFTKIDINQCPLSEGNHYPNPFGGTHKCRSTTECQPLPGRGLKRGGYQCACLPGYRYPVWQEGPFLGSALEYYSWDLDTGRFDCIQVLNDSESNLDYHPSRFRPFVFIPNYVGETKELRNNSNVFDSEKSTNLSMILKQYKTVTDQNCGSLDAEKRSLPENARYGVQKQFEGQGRSALRLANFLSNYLQNIPDSQHFADFAGMKGDKVLQESHVFGEVAALVMADPKVLSAGVLFDDNAFTYCLRYATGPFDYCLGYSHLKLFGPYAYKTKPDRDDYIKVIDKAGFSEPYTKESVFSSMKTKWAAGSDSLKTFSDEFLLRLKPFNVSTTRIQHTAIYRAAGYEDGDWSAPQFKCDMIKGWVVTYTVPFFGRANATHPAQFMGVVSVDVKFDDLDINQCPFGSDVDSAFSNTAKCDFNTEFCVPAEGRGFAAGSYKCECRAGYQLPTNVTALDGDTMEQAFQAKIAGESNSYDSLSCEKVPLVMFTTTSVETTTQDDNQTSGCSSVTYVPEVALISAMLALFALSE